jgi:thioredoxin 1
MAKTFSEMIRAEKPTLVDFSAEWCGPCKMMKPVLEDLKSKIGDKANVIKVDVDKNPQAAALYQVRGVPTFILFRKGEIRWRQSGVLSSDHLMHVVDLHSG